LKIILAEKNLLQFRLFRLVKDEKAVKRFYSKVLGIRERCLDVTGFVKWDALNLVTLLGKALMPPKWLLAVTA